MVYPRLNLINLCRSGHCKSNVVIVIVGGTSCSGILLHHASSPSSELKHLFFAAQSKERIGAVLRCAFGKNKNLVAYFEYCQFIPYLKPLLYSLSEVDIVLVFVQIKIMNTKNTQQNIIMYYSLSNQWS